MPLPQIPQQGDMQRLAQIGSGLKREHGTYGAVVQRNPNGRPPGSTGTPAPRASQPALPPVSEDHKTLTDDLARKEWVRQTWAQMATTSPTPWVLAMKQLADEQVTEAAQAVYNIIPNTGY